MTDTSKSLHTHIVKVGTKSYRTEPSEHFHTVIEPVPAPDPPPPVSWPDAPVGELARLITAASAGSSLVVPAKHYHETTRIDVAKPLDITFAGDVSSDGTLGTLMRFGGTGIIARNLAAKGAAVGATQQGYVEVGGAPGAQILDISIDGGPYTGLKLQDSPNVIVRVKDIGNAPVVGVWGWNCDDGRITGGRVHDCNLGQRGDPGWEAGGIKVGNSRRFVIGNVESVHSFGRGAWFDVYCSGAGFDGSRSHHNSHNGLMVEIQDGYYIRRAVSYEDGWYLATGKWGSITGGPAQPWWAGGILVSSSGKGQITGCLSAWSPSGITLIGQSRIANDQLRPDLPPSGQPNPPIGVNGYQNNVHDNLLTPGVGGRTIDAWSDWAGSPMNIQNATTGNAYDINNRAPTAAELTAAGVPLAPEAH